MFSSLNNQIVRFCHNLSCLIKMHSIETLHQEQMMATKRTVWKHLEKPQENNPTEEKQKSAFSFHAMDMLDILQINTDEKVLFLYAATRIKRVRKKRVFFNPLKVVIALYQ